MGMTAALLITPGSVTKHDLRQAILESIVPKMQLKDPEFYFHTPPDGRLNLISFSGDVVEDLKTVGALASSLLHSPAWIVFIVDNAGVEACWRFDGGDVSIGYVEYRVNWDPSMISPDTGESRTPIEDCFRNSGLDFLSRQFIEDLIDEIEDVERISRN